MGYKIAYINAEYFSPDFRTRNEFISPCFTCFTKLALVEKINVKSRAKWLTFHSYFENNEEKIVSTILSQSHPYSIFKYLSCKYFPRNRQLLAIANIVVYIYRIQVFQQKAMSPYSRNSYNQSFFRSFSHSSCFTWFPRLLSLHRQTHLPRASSLREPKHESSKSWRLDSEYWSMERDIWENKKG